MKLHALFYFSCVEIKLPGVMTASPPAPYDRVITVSILQLQEPLKNIWVVGLQQAAPLFVVCRWERRSFPNS